MPGHTQWVLLGIAVVLTIMIILLLSDGPKSNGAAKNAGGGGLVLTIAPASVNFGAVPVGKSKEEMITVSASMPAVISDIAISPETSGLSLRETCKAMSQISGKLTCTITLVWTPADAAADGKNVVNIKYYDANGSEDMEKLETINISFAGAGAEISADIPEPAIVEDQPAEPDIPEVAAEEPAPMDAAEDPVFDPEPIVEDALPELPEPEPIPEINAEPMTPVILDEPKVDNYVPTAEECYQFAFAGYNNTGKQIGWIKPSGGRYMFHPFEDKSCSDPTGEYNLKTGFIMSLGDSPKKIGSDAEHVGWRAAGSSLVMPSLANPAPPKVFYRAEQDNTEAKWTSGGNAERLVMVAKPTSKQLPSSHKDQATFSSEPYDRTFVLRHFKPIPATIVNEIRAVEGTFLLPVQATVDRHVYSDNGRTIIVPAGTLMLGQVEGDMPGPYKTIGRINITWYRFIRPDGVEFNFTKENDKPFSGDSQGRIGVPGHGSSDYLEQAVLPILTAIVPAATNLIAPISDTIVNQIDLDNNVVVQKGQMRSSELAKQEMISSWNKITEKLFIDMLDNTKPPFSIAAGTRITVYSPTDLVVVWCETEGKCTPEGANPSENYARADKQDISLANAEPETKLGQVASYISGTEAQIKDARMKSLMSGFTKYQSKGMAASNVYNDQLEKAGGIIKKDGSGVIEYGTDEYNQEILGMKKKQDDEGNDTKYWENPNNKFSPPAAAAADDDVVECEDGSMPDGDGCCSGETLTETDTGVWNCCPAGEGDCFPPIK